jgi:hypothetical protein
MSKYKGASENAIKNWQVHIDPNREGAEYEPFLRVQDIPSKGLSRKVMGLKTMRIHHYLSDLEYYKFIEFEFDPVVIDIREQYALSRDKTMELAKVLDIKHPVYPNRGNPIVMTTDFLVTFMAEGKKEFKAISIKPFKEVDPEDIKNRSEIKRTLNKLIIEKCFWEDQGVDWQLQTENDIALMRALNLDMLRTTLVATELNWLEEHLSVFIDNFHSNWKSYLTLNEILQKIGQALHLNLYQSFNLFGRAVWKRLLMVDLDSDYLGHNFPIQLLH